VYFPNGPKGDNTDWLKDIALSNKSYLLIIVNEAIHMYYSNFTKTILLAET